MASKRDYEQIIQDVHDEPDHALQVNVVAGTLNVTNPSVGTTGTTAPASATEVAGVDGSGNLQALSVDSAGVVQTHDSQANTTLTTLNSKTAGALVPTAYDEVDLSYVAAGNGVGQIQTATYKLSGSTVKTLTLSYDGSNRLSSVLAT